MSAEGDRIARSVAFGLIVAALVGVLLVSCDTDDEDGDCASLGLAAAQKPGPRPAPPQRAPSLEKKQPAAPRDRARPVDQAPALDAPSVRTASPSPTPTKKRRHHDIDICD